VAPCASGTWGDIPIEPDTEHVDASYTGGASDGSAAAPWITVQAGIDAALPGAIVAVAAGSYVEDVLVLGKSVRLWGKCPAEVELVGTGAAFAALAIQGASASGSEVRRLAVRGQATGLRLFGSEDVLVQEAWIHDNESRGVHVEDLFGPTSLTMRGSLLERNHEVGVHVSGSNAAVEATVVRDTLPDAKGLGRGINVQLDPVTGARSNVVVKSSLLERNHEAGVHVSGSDATVEATVVREAFPDAQGLYGRAVQVQLSPETGAAASALLRASLFERSLEAGIMVVGPATPEVDACVVRDTLANQRGFLGDGLVVWSLDGPASAAVTATVIERSDRAAVSSFGATVALGSSLLMCQSFDIGAEPWEGQNAVFDDLGGVLCGCPEATERCLAKSYALEPPPPVGGLE
jgi:hypothetical protein